MTTTDIAVKYCLDQDAFEDFLREYKLHFSKGFMSVVVDDKDVDEYVRLYKKAYEDDSEEFDDEYYEADEDNDSEPDSSLSLEERIEVDREKRKADAEMLKEKKSAIAKMLISSGFSFEGYKITKYSGYISGDDAVEIPRGSLFGRSHNPEHLTDALVKIRRQALQELKEAAYDLGCNAIIGVDFDYITLEPETANITGGTTYEPYVICVTANGNAVVIEIE